MEPRPPRPRATPERSFRDDPRSGPAGEPGRAAFDPASRPAWAEPRGGAYPGSYGPPAAPIETPTRRGRRRLVGAVLGALLAVALLGSLAFAYDRRRDGDERERAALAAQTATRSAEVNSLATLSAMQTQAAVPTPTPPPASPTAPPASPTAPTLPTVATGAQEATAPAAQARPRPTRTPTPRPRATTIAAMLPVPDDVPPGMVQTVDDQRTAAAVAAAFGDLAADAEQRLNAWEWKGNVYRRFEVPADLAPDPGTTIFLEVSIHRFGSGDQASEALTYFTDDVAASGQADIEVEPLGDEVRALQGGDNGTDIVTLYTRRGPILIKVAGYAPAGDPTEDVVALAETILAK